MVRPIREIGAATGSEGKGYYLKHSLGDGFSGIGGDCGGGMVIVDRRDIFTGTGTAATSGLVANQLLCICRACPRSAARSICCTYRDLRWESAQYHTGEDANTRERGGEDARMGNYLSYVLRCAMPYVCIMDGGFLWW